MKGRAKFSVLLQIRFWWVFPSPFNLDICTVNRITETEGIHEEVVLKPLLYSWSVSFKFSFCGGKTRFTLAIAADKRASSHNFRMKSFNLLFRAIYLLSRGKCLYINQPSMRENNNFRKIISWFSRKDCRNSPYHD